MESDDELTAQQRAALVTVRLMRGEQLTNQQVARMCGYVERHSAYYLMMRLARVLPLTFSSGVWFLIEDGSDPLNG